jgi:hypothetical protein
MRIQLNPVQIIFLETRYPYTSVKISSKTYVNGYAIIATENTIPLIEKVFTEVNIPISKIHTQIIPNIPRNLCGCWADIIGSVTICLFSCISKLYQIIRNFVDYLDTKMTQHLSHLFTG